MCTFTELCIIVLIACDLHILYWSLWQDLLHKETCCFLEPYICLLHVMHVGGLLLYYTLLICLYSNYFWVLCKAQSDDVR